MCPCFYYINPLNPLGCAGGAAWGAGEGNDDNAALLQAMRDKEKAALQALNDMLQVSE